MVLAGRILSVIGGGFMIFDAVIHTANPPFVAQSFAQLGYSPGVATPLGVVEIILVALYLIPRTSVFGALLLTGYLGGAVATNVRVGAPWLTNILFPVYVALFLWGGLWGRNAKVRAVVPIGK